MMLRWSAMFCSAMMLLLLMAPPGAAEPVADTVPPVVNITGPTLLVNSTTVNVTWEGSDEGSGISHYNVSMDWKPGIEVLDTYLLFFKLEQGEHEVVVTAFDHAGNNASHNLTFVIDSHRPAVYTFPEATQVVLYSSVGAFFKEPMNRSSVVLIINGTIVPIDWYENSDGSCGCYWLYRSLEAAAQYNVTITGQDLAGNAVKVSWSFWTITYGAIHGWVLDENGDPIYDALVVLDNARSIYSTPDGDFAMTDIAPGICIIEVSKAGYRSVSMNVTVGTLEQVEIGNITLAHLPPSADQLEQGPSDFTWLLFIIVPIGVILVLMPYLIKRKLR